MSKRMLMVLSGACGLAAPGMARAQAPAATETVLHNFSTSAPKGGTPYAGVIRDSAGNLYGTTWEGRTGGAGLVYKLDTAGHPRVLYRFTGGADGGYPFAGVVRDAAGNYPGQVREAAFSGGIDPGNYRQLIQRVGLVSDWSGVPWLVRNPGRPDHAARTLNYSAYIGERQIHD